MVPESELAQGSDLVSVQESALGSAQESESELAQESESKLAQELELGWVPESERVSGQVLALMQDWSWRQPA